MIEVDELGLDNDTAFEINGDGVIVRRDGKEIPECSLKSTKENERRGEIDDVHTTIQT